ncbi:nuclear transport factor 2 family protein [Alteromonadaceae bacterium BrNp21-10]|nr:nuclear transport factor 2 family protein [Alteromonadaceae bacterium BrNp21-10]
MKSIQLVIVAVISLLSSTTALGENNTNTDENSVMAEQQNFYVTQQAESDKLIALSKQKWQWMADKNVDDLAALFHEESKFVHMSGSWKKAREMEIIESGSIWYKNTLVHDTDVEIIGNTAVLWSRITLEAHVRGNDVSNEFTATEVYVKTENRWLLLGLTFSSVRDTHKIEH